MQIITIFAADITFCFNLKVAATLQYGIIIMNTNKNVPYEIRECDYKGEHYSAREDGMIMRHAKSGMRKRKFDDVWTYGSLNVSNGYLFLSSIRVHIIVATAFHGDHDSKVYVVDHVDTNRQNNRPDNLRWLTRLENALNNEITRKKIELICGSIEAFINNPSLLRGYENNDKNFGWMRTVSCEEARNSFENWTNWAKTTTATHDPNYKKGEIGEWIYQKPKFVKSIPSEYETNSCSLPLYDFPSQQSQEKQEDDNSLITDSLTPLAAQYHWKTPTIFPCCPNVINKNGLLLYKANLINGNIFSSNDYFTYYVVDKDMWAEGDELIVLATDNKEQFQSWSIVSIKMTNGKYVHKSIERNAGKELSIRFFKYLIGEGDLSENDLIMLDCI